jgi:hypothetical protein
MQWHPPPPLRALVLIAFWRMMWLSDTRQDLLRHEPQKSTLIPRDATHKNFSKSA